MWGETVTRVRRGPSPGLDRYRKPLPGADVETPIEGAAFAPEGSPESVEVGRVVLSEAPKLYFRQSRPDIVASDRLRVRGDLYDVSERPADWRDPWGSDVGGLVVTLKRSEG